MSRRKRATASRSWKITRLRINNAPADSWRKGVVSWTACQSLARTRNRTDGTVRERAEDEAINVFAQKSCTIC